MADVSIEQFRQMQAQGKFKSHRRRHTPGEMNKTEQKMADELAIELAGGTILWWAFEGITLKLAHDCRLTPDFAILHTDGSLELRDTKGFMEDDARAKIAMAADKFWLFKFTVYEPTKGGWKIKQIK
jgi:hypothetical protein